jgi:putative inorganic carbon (HCO3(-)) transporter
MRDFFIVAIVLGSVPLTLIRPQIGILMWFWVSLMNPHRLAWGYAQNFRVALVIGGTTLVAWIASREPKRPPSSAIVYTLAAFTFWISLSAFLAIRPEVALPKWEETMKILAMTFVTICIVRSRDRIDQLVWVIALSLGFYGVKGGIFGIMTGGTYRVWGPEGSFIEDNNSLALALIMTLPFMQYLRVHSTRQWLRLGLLGAMGLTIVAILLSYSRGAFVGIFVMLAFLSLKARNRLITALVIFGALGAVLTTLPAQWWNRMLTIEAYETDQSALGRFDAWTFAYKLALDHPLFGGGQLVGKDDGLFHRYVPTAPTSRAAHSIYFEVLGENGFVGLGLFLFLLLSSFRTAGKIIRAARDRPDLAWARSLAAMAQVSLVGYAVSGAFLSLGFFDLYYVLVALIASLQQVVNRELPQSIVPTVATPRTVAGRALQSPPLRPVAMRQS